MYYVLYSTKKKSDPTYSSSLDGLGTGNQLSDVLCNSVRYLGHIRQLPSQGKAFGHSLFLTVLDTLSG